MALCCAFPLVCAQGHIAILVAQYGSSLAETRKKTIDLIFHDIQADNSAVEVREAYIAPYVRKKMAQEGVRVDSPLEAMMRLRLDGYDTVYVLPTLLLDGTEMSELRKEIEKAEPMFKKVVVGSPLLHNLDDFRDVVSILRAASPKASKRDGVVYVGHGNTYSSTGTYSILDNMLKDESADNIFVSTIEGYPTFKTTIRQLQDSKIKHVTLVPLLLVCGNHTLKDIDGDYRSKLESEGFKVDVLFRGLAEIPEIRELYKRKAKSLLK